MINDLRYTVRSREIVDLIAAMRNGSILLSPFFQRNLVWRDSHKRDFIDTILKGYPFPQIFLARGPIDLETMTASQAVVDGQQRLSAIRDFVSGKLEVQSRVFRDLDQKEKEYFLKYEVAVIDFDLDASDPRLKDVFHRLNRTYYSLSAIERLASEYSASEFMLVARVLCGEITTNPSDFDLSDVEDEDAVSARASKEANIFNRDPAIDDDSWAWLLSQSGGEFSQIIQNKPIFSKFEFDRKIPLMFTLNVMSTYLLGYYERNDRVRKMLDERSDSFPENDEVIEKLNYAAEYITTLNLPESSAWWNKANFFTLVVELSRNVELFMFDVEQIRARALRFIENLEPAYALAAKEAVSRKPQRELRGEALRAALFS